MKIKVLRGELAEKTVDVFRDYRPLYYVVMANGSKIYRIPVEDAKIVRG